MDILAIIIQVFAMLAEHLGLAYERRPQQEELSEAIAKSLADNVTLMAKAPTGVGKSFAYLIPAILEIKNSRGVDADGFKTDKRVLVSTANKALQDQLISKDLPTLQTAMGGFTFADLKGRDNYVCLNKADGIELDGIQFILDRIESMIGAPGFTGEWDQLGITEIPGITEEAFAILRRAVTSDEDSCEDCTDGCFHHEQKEKAKESDIIVVNHSLFITDTFIRSVNPLANYLGTFHHVIVDEAHQLESFGTNVLGDKISARTIDQMLKAVQKFANMMSAGVKAEIEAQMAVVRSESDRLFSSLRAPKPEMLSWRMKKVDIDATNLAELNNAIVALRKLVPPSRIDLVMANSRAQAKKLHDRAYNRLRSHATRCKLIGTAPWLGGEGYVRVAELKGRVVELHYKPISIAPFMKANFFGQDGKGKSAVFVSATLPFKYIGKRIGVPENTRTLAVGTPFPFAENGVLYAPKDLPDPKTAPAAERAEAVAERILALVTASRGRALLLFTSKDQMNRVYDLIVEDLRLLKINVLKQGDKANKALIAEFREDIHSVLFGMDSFMTGVDFQGETCSLVVIDKMPYPIYGDPLVEARRETLENELGDSYEAFKQYMMPEMVIKLDQAMGRLIRKTTDKGVVALLDPRIRKESNDWVWDELPPFRLLGALSKTQSFLSEL